MRLIFIIGLYNLHVCDQLLYFLQKKPISKKEKEKSVLLMFMRIV
jgi:hypothetical protein